MLKRTLISGMWFVALWAVGGPVHVYLGVARPLMWVPTVLGSIAVWIGLAMYDQWRETQALSAATRSQISARQVGRSLSGLATDFDA